MFAVIRHHSKARLEAGVVEIKSKRRAALRESPDQKITEEYRELVSGETALQEQTYQEVTMKVLGELGLNEYDFQFAQQMYMTSPEYQGRFFASMQKVQDERAPKEDKKVAQSLSDREKVKEMFIFTENLKLECMEALNVKLKLGYQFDFAMESMLQYTYMSDQFFLKYEVDEEDLFKAVKDLGIQKDADIVKIMKENAEKLPPDVMMALTGQAMQGHGDDGHDHSNCGEHGHMH